MSNVNQKRTTLRTLEISAEGMDELFQQAEIAAKYKSVRESEEVENCYLEMMESVIQSCEDVRIKEHLMDEDEKAFNEEILQSVLLMRAIEKLLKDGTGDIQSSILSVITAENVIEVINNIRDSWKYALHEIEAVETMAEVIKFCFD